MKFLGLVLMILLTMAVTSLGHLKYHAESLDDVLFHPRTDIEASTNEQRRKRELNDNFKAFVESQLIQHTQALELLMRKLQKNENLLKTFVEEMSEKVNAPSLPENLMVPQVVNRRMNKDEGNNIFTKIARRAPIYGNMFKSAYQQHFINPKSDPVPVIEKRV